jgi:hypothetical protein
MLVLTRRVGEEIVIGDDIHVRILGVQWADGPSRHHGGAIDQRGSGGGSRPTACAERLPGRQVRRADGEERRFLISKQPASAVTVP